MYDLIFPSLFLAHDQRGPLLSLTDPVRRGAMTRLLYPANRANQDAAVIDPFQM